MIGMPEPQHARPAERSTQAIAAWAILICLGGTQVTFNVVSALRHSALSPVPVLAGLTPVLGAALLSHLAASRHASGPFRALVTTIMLGSMAVSIGATIEVTQPVFGQLWRAVVLGLVLDAASLAALWFVMARHSEKTATASAVEQAHADAEAARQQASDATGKVSGLEAELTAARAELEAERNRVPRLPRKRNRTGGTARTSSARNKTGTEDASIEAAALAELAANPDITGAELGRKLGVAEGYGRRLKRTLTASATGSQNAAQ